VRGWDASVPGSHSDGGTEGSAEAKSGQGGTKGTDDLSQLTAVHVFGLEDGRSVSMVGTTHPGRPVLFTLWATWCEPCLKELPRLQRLATEKLHRVAFVGIAQDLNSRDNRQNVRAIVTSAGVTFPQFLESDGLTVEERIFGHGVETLPAFALFDSRGKLVMRAVGSVLNMENYRHLTAALDHLEVRPSSVGSGKVMQ
jgi:thiol-disulfide isomerase/thioredoxin